MNYSITISDCGETFVATITDLEKKMEMKAVDNNLKTLAVFCAACMEARERQKREEISAQPVTNQHVTLETYTLP